MERLVLGKHWMNGDGVAGANLGTMQVEVYATGEKMGSDRTFVYYTVLRCPLFKGMNGCMSLSEFIDRVIIPTGVEC